MSQNKASGYATALLGLAAWIRQRKVLRVIYRLFPQSLRNWVSWRLAAPARKRVSFPHTPAWNREPPALPAIHSMNRSERWGLGVGVNIFAFFRGQFGIGESARLYARALIEAGFPVALIDIDQQLSHGLDERSFELYLGSEAPYGVHLIFVNPDYLDDALKRIGRATLKNGYVIACWFWELEIVPPEWLPALELVDEIMVSSAFVEAAFRRVTDKPILRVPLPLCDTPDSGLTREDIGLRSDAFVFLVTFDFNSWLDRKNPFAAIEAFRLAFPKGDENVQLLVKSSNGYRHPEPFLRLLEAASVDPRIVVRDQIIERHHVQALQRCSDAYISLHRSEGFGLGMAESMSLGKPVVATAWSGNVDFMDDDSALMVGYQLVPVRPGQYSHAAGQRWAEADLHQAAACMRRLVSEPGFAERLGERARKRVSEQLSPISAASVLTSRLAEIADGRNG
ncbi:glycosyltransferase family 4 protein [Dyella kyungheensis]|uniref:glycosyltransferase family 4 protein n=1 Tax=Dyella kyungheensis TaxID=1242174 RepID=UPI003CF63571